MFFLDKSGYFPLFHKFRFPTTTTTELIYEYIYYYHLRKEADKKCVLLVKKACL